MVFLRKTERKDKILPWTHHIEERIWNDLGMGKHDQNILHETVTIVIVNKNNMILKKPIF